MHKLKKSKFLNEINSMMDEGRTNVSIRKWLLERDEDYSEMSLSVYRRKRNNKFITAEATKKAIIETIGHLFDRHTSFLNKLDSYEKDIKEEAKAQIAIAEKPSQKNYIANKAWEHILNLLHLQKEELDNIGKLFGTEKTEKGASVNFVKILEQVGVKVTGGQADGIRGEQT